MPYLFYLVFNITTDDPGHLSNAVAVDVRITKTTDLFEWIESYGKHSTQAYDTRKRKVGLTAPMAPEPDEFLTTAQNKEKMKAWRNSISAAEAAVQKQDRAWWR